VKVLAYETAYTFDAFAIREIKVAEPTRRDTALLVDIRAVGINPGEAYTRSIRNASNLSWISKRSRPYGHLSAIDIAALFDASSLVSKSASLHTEMVFAKVIGGFCLESKRTIGLSAC